MDSRTEDEMGLDRLGAEPAFLLTVDEGSAGARLDRFLADRIRECSRTFLQRMIRDGNVTVDGAPAKPSAEVRPGSRVTVVIVEDERDLRAPEPEDVPVEVVWEDADVIVVNKPAGMASHPSFGHMTGTLVNALLWRSRELSAVGGPVRPGIVHRLDLDTSGLLVVAKNDRAHRRLQAQFHDRKVKKEYRAIVHGRMNPPSGGISAPIARNTRDRKRMRVAREGKPSDTEYRTIEGYARFSYLSLKPGSGRTHQLRVHLRSRGHPILCDGLYGREVEASGSYLLSLGRVAGEEPVISRQALHAMRLAFEHPSTGVACGFEAPLPADFAKALTVLAGGGGAYVAPLRGGA